MVSKVKKWGRIYGLRLPKKLLKRADIAVGDEVRLIASNHQILVRKVTKQKYDLAELVAHIPKSYKAKEVNFGLAVGRED